ncbi:Hypothetical predicted protein [Octopus vulgaris]|nr:Hypothetical predicted protein [Octopus vulgaris]
MKLVLLCLVLLPIVFSASLYDEEIDKRLSIVDVINHIKHLNLGDDCVQACEDNVPNFWAFLCGAACRIILGKGDVN